MQEPKVSAAEFRKLQAFLQKVDQLSREKGYCFASNQYLGMELGGISERQVRRRIALLDSLGWIQVSRVKEKTGRGISLTQGGQFVQGVQYHQLPENVRAGRTICPSRVANLSGGVANLSANQDIKTDQVYQGAQAPEVNNDTAGGKKAVRHRGWKAQRPGFKGNQRNDQGFARRTENHGHQVDGVVREASASPGAGVDQSGSRQDDQACSESGRPVIDFGPLIRALHEDPHFGPIIKAREERERQEAAMGIVREEAWAV